MIYLAPIIYYAKKLKKTGIRVIALKAVGAKLARANYYMLRDNIKYDPKKLFGICGIRGARKLKETNKGCGSKPKRGLAQKPTV